LPSRSVRFVCAVAGLTLFPLVASAQELPVKGTLEDNPLRIVSGLTTYTIDGQGALVDHVRAVASLGRSVAASVKSDAPATHDLLSTNSTVGLVSIGGRTTANTALFADHSASAAQLEKLDVESPITLTDVVVAPGSGASQEWFKVTLGDGSSGWVPAGFVAIGTDDPMVRAVAHAIAAPIFAHTSAANDARTFHPDGLYFQGTAKSLSPGAPFTNEAKRMEGAAVIRPSEGVHKAGAPDARDVLGFTIRLTTAGVAIGPEPQPGDENFTFLAWAQNLAEIPIALFVADSYDYFSPKNQYYAMIPYRIAETSRPVLLRVVPEPFTPDDASLANPTTGDGRDKKLEAGVAEHKAALRIQGQVQQTLVQSVLSGLAALSPIGKATPPSWVDLVRITFDAPLTMDNEAFHYYPDLAGRGLIPTGSINAIRAEVYPSSQAARPATAAARKAADAAKTPTTPGLTGAIEAAKK
jgi:hypothetical protein